MGDGFFRDLSGAVPLFRAKHMYMHPGLRHAFTTREGGVSRGHLSTLNLARFGSDESAALEENYRRLALSVGFPAEKIAFSNQVHGDTVRVVSANDALGLRSAPPPPCDALVTAERGVALLVFTADCVPILLADRWGRAVAAVHAGWRGTTSGAVRNALLAMKQAFGVLPEDVLAAIGPAIGPCCFEVDAEVALALDDAFSLTPGEIEKRGDKWFPDLKRLNALRLTREGVSMENIHISEDCTMCKSDRYFSNRKHGRMRGLQGAVILLSDE